MAFRDRPIEQDRTADKPDRAQVLLAGILLVALIATVATKALVSPDALVPVVATLLFGFAAVTAGAALLCRRNHVRITWLDIAGVLTFVGVGISVLIEPDQLVGLVTLSDRTD